MGKRLTGKRIWITGATSGIGEGLALELAGRGNRVFASGRDPKRLESLRAAFPDNIEPLAFDVSDREAALRAGEKIPEASNGLDVAVLNAGTCEYLDARAFDSAMIERVMRVNYLGMVYCIEAALPLLRAGEEKYLVGMSSTAGYFGLPRAEAYGASKAAIRYLLESLRADLTPEGFAVSIICPGFVKTPLTDRNDFAMPMRISCERAVRHIVNGMERRKHEIHFPKTFSISMKAMALLPSRLRNRLLQRIVRTS